MNIMCVLVNLLYISTGFWTKYGFHQVHFGNIVSTSSPIELDLEAGNLVRYYNLFQIIIMFTSNKSSFFDLLCSHSAWERNLADRQREGLLITL